MGREVEEEEEEEKYGGRETIVWVFFGSNRLKGSQNNKPKLKNTEKEKGTERGGEAFGCLFHPVVEKAAKRLMCKSPTSDEEEHRKGTKRRKRRGRGRKEKLR